MKLFQLNQLPPGLLDCEAHQLAEILPSPTLIHLPGRQAAPLLISVLLHGNEPAGWEALRRLLPRFEPAGGQLPLPRALSLFIGNLEAAAQQQRHLASQPDYNRIWPGCPDEAAQTPEAALMREVVDVMAQRGIFASVDIHNNTGINPHYACINRLESAFLHLGTLFSRTLVYFTRPRGVQSLAFSTLCPAVTLECGKSDQHLGAEHAAEYLSAVLHLNEHPCQLPAHLDMDLFHTLAVVKIPSNIDISFNDEMAPLRFVRALERFNFRELPSGTPMAEIEGSEQPLMVLDENDHDIADTYLEVRDGLLLTRRPIMPAMLTTDAQVIRQDCLCYFMERLPTPAY